MKCCNFIQILLIFIECPVDNKPPGHPDSKVHGAHLGPIGNKPLPKPVLTQIYFSNMVLLGHNELMQNEM